MSDSLLDIIGLGCHAGPFETLDALERGLYDGTADLGDWTAPEADDEPIHHEQRVPSAIEQALRAGKLAGEERDSVGLVLLTGAARDPHLARRYSASLGVGVPAITLGPGENDLVTAIERVRRELTGRRAVVLCATDAAGAVAVLVGNATREQRAYAVLDTAIAATGETTGAPPDVDYVGLGGDSERAREAAEAELAAEWSAERVGYWGAALAPTSDIGPRGELAALVRAALCLHHRYLPTSPSSSPRRKPGERTGLYVPLASHPWLPRSGSQRRAAVVWAHGKRRTRLLLSAPPCRRDDGYSDWSRGTDLVLLPVSGRDTHDLVAKIGRLRTAVASGEELGALARESARELSEAPNDALRAVFCVTSATVLTELDRALASLPHTHAEGRDWTSPGGSYCAVRPIGPDGKIALVFPGLFTAYAGLGQQLLRCFPDAYTFLDSLAATGDRTWLSEATYRALGAYDSQAELEKLEAELLGDYASLTMIGLVFSRVHVDILRQILRARTFGAFGYSLGELSMLTAMDCWDLGRADESPLTSATFRDAAEATRRAASATWGAPDRPDTDPVWGSRVVFANADEIRARLGRYDRVYLTHVNTPEEAVIAGDRAQCEALATEVGRPSIASAVGHGFHTPWFDGRMVSEPATPARLRADVEMFTSNGCRPLRGTGAEITTNLREVLRRPVDFPRLVRAAYLSGYRYFLEVGPGGTCTRWIGDTLTGRPHVAEAVERRGVPGARSLAQVLAKLVSHGVPVRLESLLPARPESLVGAISLVGATSGRSADDIRTH